jgi:uracil-DNA glycosylase
MTDSANGDAMSTGTDDRRTNEVLRSLVSEMLERVREVTRRTSAWSAEERAQAEAELEIIRPRLLIPVGKLAIEKFLPSAPLDQLIGRTHEVDHAGGHSRVIPLPHPSGASSWVNAPRHRELLERALDLLAVELAAIWGASAARRSA